MASSLALRLLCIGIALRIGRTQAWSAHNEAGEYEEDLIEQCWQMGLKSWQQKCEKYKNEEREAKRSRGARLAGGQLAEPGMLPHQVALLLQLDNDELQQCGGALISLKHVLTAAHCLDEVLYATIYLGAVKYANIEDAAEVFKLSRHFFNIHPDYFQAGYFNDLAIIRLPRLATANKRVQPIALALPFMQQSLLQGQLVSSSGWGALGHERSQSADLLQYVEVQVLEQQRCVCHFLPDLVSRRQHICISGRGGRGACEGDSGGPLVYQWLNVSYLVGVTSFGARGCGLGTPSVYMRITGYLDWIVGELGGES